MTGAWNKYTLERPQKDGPTEVAHYVETYDDGSRHVLCSRKNVVATPVAVWNVAHDVGRVPLCESCKDAIRTSAGSGALLRKPAKNKHFAT